MPSAPIVILVRPQLGENIGAAARAMSNFGLSQLRIAAPRDGWPNSRALETASGAAPIIESAELFPDLAAALHDVQLAYAATARPRDMQKRVVTPEEAMERIARSSARCALVFGPERTGLENEEIVQCDTLITIPTAPENSSLNLAQSVVVLGYEWFKRSGKWQVVSSKKESASLATYHLPLATGKDWQGLFSQLEEYLDDINYYRVAHKKEVMWQNLQNMLTRGRWSEQEVRTFRGMLRGLWEREKKRR